MIYRVRVRGIYSTAIGKLLSGKGFLLTDLSEVLRRRLGMPLLNAPADVTVKEGRSPDQLVIVGHPWEAGSIVEEAILGEIRHGLVKRANLGLHTVVVARSRGNCLGDVGGLSVKIEGECPPSGVEFRGRVVREDVDTGDAVISPGVAAVGRYVTLWSPGSGVSVSRHVKEEDLVRELLEEVSSTLDLSEVHVHFRSNSRLGPPASIISEVKQLLGELASLEEKPGEGGIVRRGEYLSVIYLPEPGKSVLDEYRGSVTPTIAHHHSLKASGKMESLLVDYAEYCLETGRCSEGAGDSLVEFIASSLKGKKVWLRHYKPGAGEARIGPFKVESTGGTGEPLITLTRRFTKPGLYDGLKVEKKPGDTGRSEVRLGEWFIIHEYYRRDGEFIGAYANVNTPPEVSFEGIRYLDLLVDVVKAKGEKPRVIDEGELLRFCDEGLITGDTCAKALETVKRLKGMLESRYP